MGASPSIAEDGFYRCSEKCAALSFLNGALLVKGPVLSAVAEAYLWTVPGETLIMAVADASFRTDLVAGRVDYPRLRRFKSPVWELTLEEFLLAQTSGDYVAAGG